VRAYWSALDILKQVAGELGLPQPVTINGTQDVQTLQLLSLLNSAGNELLMYYTWEQFTQQWNFNTEEGKDSYDLPLDYNYFVDQTQWDRTNFWPLLGPKSAQEWAWLKGGLLAAAPRLRYRVMNNKFWLHPTPQAGPDGFTPFNLNMEYLSCNWVATTTNVVAMVTLDGDLVQYDPWMVIKFIKMKFYELKGFDTTATTADFMRIFNALTGKSRGAPKLSLSPRYPPLFIGPWSIPDGSWDVGVSMTP
jgi:hypothetical protein